MKKILFMLMMVLAAFPAGAGAAKTPAWINGVSGQYPQKEYLLGVGIGDSLESARSSARAEIARTFKARIVQVAQDLKNERITQEGSSSRVSSRQDIAVSTSVSTDELLQGVEIAETWFQEKNKTYYALAVLNKQKNRRQLMQEIIDQEEIISRKMTQAKSGGSIIEKLRAVNGALDAINRKEELIARKQVLDPVPVGEIAAGVNGRAEIEHQRAVLISRIRFTIQADETPQLAARITEKITGLGFTTVPAPGAGAASDTVVLMVTARTTVNPVDRDNPQWKFFGWQGTATIADASDTGRTIASVVREGQASHVTSDAARTKAVLEAVQALASSVEQEIKKYLSGK